MTDALIVSEGSHAATSMIESDRTHEKADDELLVTEPFITRSSDYFTIVLIWWLFHHGWILIQPILVVAVIGIIMRDERIAITALLMLFIVMPMVMAFIFIYYMLVPEVGRMMLRKRVVIARGKYLRIEYLPEPLDETDEAAGDDTGVQERIPHADVTIMWDAINRVITSHRFTIFVLNSKRLQLIMVPNDTIKRVSESNC